MNQSNHKIAIKNDNANWSNRKIAYLKISQICNESPLLHTNQTNRNSSMKVMTVSVSFPNSFIDSAFSDDKSTDNVVFDKIPLHLPIVDLIRFY